MSFKKKAVVASAVLLGATVAIPMAISGPAYAQENSRICGIQWEREGISGPVEFQDESGVRATVNERHIERVTKFYEVQKSSQGGLPSGGIAVCNLAEKGGAERNKNPSNHAPVELLDKMIELHGNKKFEMEDWVVSRTFSFDVCENFGHNAGVDSWKNWEFLPDRAAYPAGSDNDICTFMERSDTVSDMEAYWALATTQARGTMFVAR